MPRRAPEAADLRQNTMVLSGEPCRLYCGGRRCFQIVCVALGYVFSSLRVGDLVWFLFPGHRGADAKWVFSPLALIWARCRLLFGRFPGGPVYFRAGPVYFRVCHANLSNVFPSSLSHVSNGRSCFPRLSWVGPDVMSFRVAAWGPVHSRTGPGLYLSQTT